MKKLPTLYEKNTAEWRSVACMLKPNLILFPVFCQVLNSDANYHTKMRNKRTDPGRWQRVLGEGNVFAVMPHFHTHKVRIHAPQIKSGRIHEFDNDNFFDTQ